MTAVEVGQHVIVGEHVVAGRADDGGERPERLEEEAALGPRRAELPQPEA